MNDDSEKPNLIYTIALEQPGSDTFRLMAKMLVSSLLRTHFTGDIVVFRNSPTPYFKVPKRNVREVLIDTSNIFDLADFATRFKAHSQTYIDPDHYENIMFIDCDCLALRNIDHLLKDHDRVIRYAAEPGHGIHNVQFNAYLTAQELELDRDGANSGIWIVKGHHYSDVMSRWTAIDEGSSVRTRNCADQPAWNRLLLDLGPQATPFAWGEIQYPVAFETNFEHYRHAALVHFCAGIPPQLKTEFQFGVFCQRFLSDKASHWLDILDP